MPMIEPEQMICEEFAVIETLIRRIFCEVNPRSPGTSDWKTPLMAFLPIYDYFLYRKKIIS